MSIPGLLSQCGDGSSSESDVVRDWKLWDMRDYTLPLKRYGFYGLNADRL